MMKTMTTWMAMTMAIIVVATMRVSCSEVLEGRKVQLPSMGAVVNETSLCLESVVGTGVCVQDLLTSLVNLQFRLGTDCCKAISVLDDHCFKPIFASFPFIPELPSFLNSFCLAIPSKPPTPAHK